MSGLLSVRKGSNGWPLVVLAASLGMVSVARASTSPQPPQQSQETQPPVFRSGVTLVTTDVIVRDGDGQFLSDLTEDEFVVYEDDVRQEVSSLVLVHGGRVFDILTPPKRPAQEGIILPGTRMVDDTAGRIIVLFVDDMHFRPDLTPQVRRILRSVRDELVHEGDLFGIIATGTSNLSSALSYDRSLIDAASARLMGGGMDPKDLMETQRWGGVGNSEVRWRAHVAFKTAREALRNLEPIHNRRKVFLYISTGYDFDPFGEMFDGRNTSGQSLLGSMADLLYDPIYQVEQQGKVFSDADLHAELAELARAANRANTSFYTLDPRGLTATMDVQYNLPAREWGNHIFRTQSSLRALAELTGGTAIVNRNDFEAGLREIDAETSDYYVLGFYTDAPEAGANRTRTLRIEVEREDAVVRSRERYTFDRTAQP